MEKCLIRILELSFSFKVYSLMYYKIIAIFQELSFNF
jgi:hypothetical protein